MVGQQEMTGLESVAPRPPGTVVRIATWNLERPRRQSWKIVPRQRERMAAVDADLWVLTETRASLAPVAGMYGHHCPPRPGCDDHDERYTSLWSRWPFQPSDVGASPRGTVSAIVQTPIGPLVLYGTVIPWANDRGEDGRSTMWAEHQSAIVQQGLDWEALRYTYPEAPLVVAGDFNQDRDGSGWYGTHRGRDLLTRELARNDLVCVTAEDVVATGKLADHHLIDHICIGAEAISGRCTQLSCLPTHDPDQVRLSDHPTVIIDLIATKPAPVMR